MTTYKGKTAIPLVLPNNCTWDEQTGKYEKTGGERKTLEVIQQALDQLREINGPVCVLAMAGPCRNGKSYLLSKAFEQGEVFPLGHLVDPETMGIWLWVVPQKYKDSTGRDFTVVLLDSEGIDSVYAKTTDDHRIFTLSVLLSSILIYNSVGVPKKGDLEGLEFIVKLSQHIQLHTKQKATDKDDSHFYEAFPNFIWLLRDELFGLPNECSDFKEYFLKKVFNVKSAESSEKDKETGKSILKFFSGFDALSLPPPAYDPEIVKNLNDKKSEEQANPKFFKEIEVFKKKLHSKLAPKKSIYEGELVTGEALAALVQLFVEALNTPGTVPNVQNAWDTFVQNKCIMVTNEVLKNYEKEMTSRMKHKIPCEADVIRSEHNKEKEVALKTFRQETLDLSTISIKEYLAKLTEETENTLAKWMKKNEEETDTHCSSLLKGLKKTILDPVFAGLHGPKGSSMEFKEMLGAYSEMENAYHKKARGDLKIRAVVFLRFHQDFQREMQRNLDILQKMKDYDASLMEEKRKLTELEKDRNRAQEEKKRTDEALKAKEKEKKFLFEKFEKEKLLLQKNFEEKLEVQNKQLTDIIKANFDQLEKEREAANAQQKTLNDFIEEFRKDISDKKEKEIEDLRREVKAKEDREKELEKQLGEARTRTRWQNFKGIFTGE